MLTNEEHQAMIMFDRLLMAARDNDTVADLLDQTLNVARMIDPRAEDKVVYGPLQRMHFEWQAMQHRLNELGKKMDQYIANQNRFGQVGIDPNYNMTGGMGTTSWPSNPGWDIGHKFNSSNYPTSMTAITAEDLHRIKSQISNISAQTTGIHINTLPTPKTNK